MKKDSGHLPEGSRYAFALTVLLNVVGVIYLAIVILTLLQLGVVITFESETGTVFGSLPMQVETSIANPPDALVDSTQYHPEGNLTGEMMLTGVGVPRGPMIVAQGSVLWALLAAGFVLHRLRRVVGLYAKRQPFHLRNARDIRWIGWLILTGYLGKEGFDWWTRWLVAQQIGLPDFTLTADFDFNILTFTTGLIVLLIAEVFRYGAQLQTEHDLTI